MERNTNSEIKAKADLSGKREQSRKYRAKILDTNKWVYGDVYDNGINLRICDKKSIYDTKEYTIGEYCPILDAYEGDLLKFEGMSHIFEIFKGKYAMLIRDRTLELEYRADLFKNMKRTIIGNIYEL